MSESASRLIDKQAGLAGKVMSEKRVIQIVKRAEREQRKNEDNETPASDAQVVRYPERESAAIVSAWVREFQKKKSRSKGQRVWTAR